MKKLDLYWKSNREWWEYKDHIPAIKSSAPTEAKQSYERYLEQIKDVKAL